MELYLQMGYGMKAHAIELIKKWGGGTVILSPKNMDLDQMKKLAETLKDNNGSILIDPQFYIPRTSQEKLNLHSYWPNDFDTNKFFNGEGINNMIDILLNDYVNPIESSGFIIPTLFLDKGDKDDNINEDWIKITDTIVETIEKKQISIPKFLTVCIGYKLLERENLIHLLIEQIEDYPVDGFYIIPVHPNNLYLVDNESWLLNLLDLAAGLKLLNKKVIVGYSNHQFLFLSLAKVDAICSGIWLKTRVFPIGEFKDEEEDAGRRSVWYYCPHALSEYQIPALDIAYRVGLLEQMKTPDNFESNYADILFKGAQPTTVNFSERESFRHYLHCLKKQCRDVSKDSYENTKEYLRLIFETALDLSDYFKKNGVRAKHRDFSNVAESNLAVLDGFDNIRGLVYGVKWSNI